MAPIELKGALVRSEAEAHLASWQTGLRSRLTQAISPGSEPLELTVSLKGIEKIDTAGLAVLLHMAREARQNQTELLFKDASAQLLALADLCSLTKLLRFV